MTSSANPAIPEPHDSIDALDSRRGFLTRHAIVAVSVALIAIGIVAVASATASLDQSLTASLRWGEPLGRQLVFAVAGVIVLLAASRLSPWWLRRRRLHMPGVLLLAAVTVVALCLPLIPGLASEQRGSARWLRIPLGSSFINIQPSEFAKFTLVVFLAWWLTRPWVNLRSFTRGYLPVLVSLAAFVGLVGIEDLGTAALIGMVGGLMVITAGCHWPHVVGTGLLGLGGLVGLFLLKDYRQDRLTAFLNPESDLAGVGYQPFQSLKTIASGGWSGTGLGAGIQKYGYLPESHTDFIFALICEESGVVGAMLVMGRYVCLIWLGLRIMRYATGGFERMLAFGFTSMIGWQAVMNMAVVVVLAPTTGISLPLISAGGSGLLTYSLVLGLLGGLAYESRFAPGACEPALESDSPISYGSRPLPVRRPADGRSSQGFGAEGRTA